MNAKIAPSPMRDAGVPRHHPITTGKVLVWGAVGILLYVAHVAFIPIACMEINLLLIFLALWFGGLFWGIAGIVLATPTLVALKVIAEHTSSGKLMMEFMGPNDQTPDRDSRLKKLAASSH